MSGNGNTLAYHGEENVCWHKYQLHEEGDEVYDEETGEVIGHTDCEHWVYVSDTNLVTCEVQSICVLSQAVRWYAYKIVCLSLDIPQYASLIIEKTVYDKQGNILDVDDTFYFELVVDGTTVETIAVATESGEGTATSTKILLENGSASYKVIELDKDGYTLNTDKSSGMTRNPGERIFIYRNRLGGERSR